MFNRAKTFLRTLAVPAFFLAALAAIITGCETMQQSQFTDVTELSKAATNVIHAESIILREGDVIKIVFPTAPNLNTASIPIMRDGTVTLPVVGVVRAAGKTLAELQDDLVKLYSAQVESKQVTVELLSSGFPIFVTGAVLRPGKVLSDHPMTALEAIMEAGGPDYARADLKHVTVLRREGKHLRNYGLNIKQVMRGDEVEPFYMKPDDILYVKERFQWF
jgi:polysaccharide export outer membrane protein